MNHAAAAPVALVTGAAGGIGSAVVTRLLAEGYRVVGLDLRSVVEPEPHPEVVWLRGDVRVRADLDAAVATALDRWGRLDVVVAAAADDRGGRPLWETSPEELDELWRTDALGVWQTAAASIPAMLGSADPSRCRFVAIASAAGRHGMFHLAGYNAVKHAVVGMMRGLAADLVGTGVAAITVSPGATRTAMLERTAQLYDVDVAELVARQGVRRALEPDEVAAVVATCCSFAGAALHGAVVPADGGFGL